MSTTQFALNILSSIITISTAAFIAYDYISKRRRHLKDHSIFKDAIQNCSDKFKVDFITKDSERKYFYYATGIDIKTKFIHKLINLEEKLGRKGNWKKINSVLPYLKFDKEEVYVCISKSQVTINKIVKILMFLFFLIGVILIFQVYRLNQSKLISILYLGTSMLSFIYALKFKQLYNQFKNAKEIQEELFQMKDKEDKNILKN